MAGYARTLGSVSRTPGPSTPPSFGAAQVAGFTIPQTAYSAEVLADAPLLYWRLEDAGSTHLIDASGNGHDGAAVSVSAEPGAFPPLGIAGVFDGTTSRIVASSAFNPWSGAITVEAVVKTTAFATGTNKCIVGSDSSNPQIVVTTTGAIAWVYSGISSSNWPGSWTAVGDGTSAHVVVAFDPANVANCKLYINGNDQGAASGTAGAYGATGNVTAGARAAAPTNFFGGSLDEIAIYSGILSPARVLAHYQAAAGAGPSSETPIPGGAVASGLDVPVLVPGAPGGAVAGGTTPASSALVSAGGAVAGGTPPVAATSAPQGGAVASGTVSVARVPVAQGGATAAGTSPTPAPVSVSPGGAVAGGTTETVRVPVSPGGAVAGGFPPTASGAVSETPIPGGATAGGFAPVARVSAAQGGAVAGGTTETTRVSVPQGGAVAGGLAPAPRTSHVIGGAIASGTTESARVPVTQGGAVAGGFPPTVPGITETPGRGGVVAGGFAPVARITTPLGGAIAGGLSPASRATVTQGGGVAGGLGAVARVAVVGAVVTAAGRSPSIIVVVPPGGAVAGGFEPHPPGAIVWRAGDRLAARESSAGTASENGQVRSRDASILPTRDTTVSS